MNVFPGFVYSPNIIEYRDKVAAREKRTVADKWRRRCIFATVLTSILFTSNIIQTSSLWHLIPLKEIVPILLWRHDNGAIEAAVTTDSMSISMTDISIQTWLWQYTMWRESYAAPMMDWAHHVVMSMSTVKVADAYDTWVGAHSNPNAYQNVYADKCSVRVVQEEGDPQVRYEPSKDGLPGTYLFHFWRKVECRGERPQKVEEFTASLRFITAYRGSGLKWADIRAFNPERIVVTDYAPPVPVQAMTKGFLSQ